MMEEILYVTRKNGHVQSGAALACGAVSLNWPAHWEGWASHWYLPSTNPKLRRSVRHLPTESSAVLMKEVPPTDTLFERWNSPTWILNLGLYTIASAPIVRGVSQEALLW
uniref:Uncharacterized protein n=1 Tax=Bionectria ochroleuca TaxID=29856 RepID=A0A8H7N9W4_BIOOC